MSSIAKKYLSPAISEPVHCGHDAPAMSFLEDGNQYVLDCLTSTQALALIAGEWKHLEQNCSEPYTYFQSYDWCHQWCIAFAQTGEEVSRPSIKVYILRRNGELIMVWPMMVVKSWADLNNLTFLTEPHGQYGNIICNRKLLEVEVGKRIWKHIRKNSGADAITLDQYPQSSLLKQIIDGNGLVENSDKHASILDLTAFETWDDYRASQGRKQRKQRNQRRNKLARHGKVNYEVHYGGSKRYRELVALALQWKRVWLHETGRRATVLSQDSTRKFLSGLTGEPGKPDASPNGVVLGALTLDDEPIGIEIGMCLDGHYYCYLGAFEWQHRHLSPGKIQMEEAQIWAKEAGLRNFDYLGDPADYKASWTNTMDALESRSVPVTLRGFFYCVFWKANIKPAARLIFNKTNAKNRAKLLSVLGIRESAIDKNRDSDSTSAGNNTVAPTAKTYAADK